MCLNSVHPFILHEISHADDRGSRIPVLCRRIPDRRSATEHLKRLRRCSGFNVVLRPSFEVISNVPPRLSSSIIHWARGEGDLFWMKRDRTEVTWWGRSSNFGQVCQAG